MSQSSVNCNKQRLSVSSAIFIDISDAVSVLTSIFAISWRDTCLCGANSVSLTPFTIPQLYACITEALLLSLNCIIIYQTRAASAAVKRFCPPKKGIPHYGYCDHYGGSGIHTVVAAVNYSASNIINKLIILQVDMTQVRNDCLN